MEIDLLILTVYFICIGYVVYQMALSLEAELEDQVVLVPNGEYLENSVKTQLAQQGLSELTVEVLNPPPPPLKSGLALRTDYPKSYLAQSCGCRRTSRWASHSAGFCPRGLIPCSPSKG